MSNMTEREKEIFAFTEILAKAILKSALVGADVNVNVKVETADGIIITVETKVGG